MVGSLLLHARSLGASLLGALAVCGAAHAAVYNFKATGAAQKRPEITNAGSYVFVQVMQDPTSPNRVFFRFTSRIPQPVAGVGQIAFDTGADKALFSAMSVMLQSGTEMAATSTGTHAYLPGFNPTFAFGPTGASGLYDPRSLQPGDTIVIAGVLGPGRSFAHVVNALNQGLSSNPAVAKGGLRIGLIAHHLLGRRPDPTKTIMDDAGFMVSTMVAQ